jgi:hypothetical protein
MNRGGRNQGGGSARPFSESDVSAIAELPSWRPSLALSAQANAVSEEANWVTSIQGGHRRLLRGQQLEGREGRDFTAQEVQGGAAVALSSARRLPPTSSRDGNVAGSADARERRSVEVIGILESKGQSGGGGMGRTATT